MSVLHMFAQGTSQLWPFLFEAGTYILTELRLKCILFVTPPCHCMQAEESLARKNLDKEYADILGIPAFRQATAELMLTKSCPFVQKKQVGLDVCSSCLSVMLNESYVCMYVCMYVPFSSVCSFLLILSPTHPHHCFCRLLLLRPSLALGVSAQQQSLL